MASFKELGVAERCSALLQQLGIKEPTPVQAQTIPIVLTGKDVISQAQTGTGKTLAFVLPILERIKADSPYLQGLIVTPTRELALQITEEIRKLLPAYEGVRVLPVYGGQDVEAQLHKLQGHVHLIVATPGRLLDHMRRETVRLSNVRMLVLDEADQMLHMGFLGEVEDILSQTPRDRQTMLFSATMPDKIRSLAGRILRSPEEVTVRAKQVTVKDTEQLVIETTDRAKQSALVAMIEETKPYLGIIFCRTKRRASTLNEALQGMGYACDELHGDLSQAKREQVMRKFREARLQLLVATDIAARGLDVEGVTHVFNYDVPQDAESYIHRIGRTGRAGESGVAITFIAPKDRGDLGVIESGIGMGIERRTIGQSGSVRVAEREPRAGRTPGAFGRRGAAAGGRAGAEGRGGRVGGSRGGSRGEGRGAAGRGTAGGRGAAKGRSAGAESAPAGEARWWEQGKYFTPAPSPEAAAAGPKRRPGAGGPGNGRKGDAPVEARGRRGGSGAGEFGGRGDGRAAERSGGYRGGAAGERPAKAYGASAERPRRGTADERGAGRGGRPGAAAPGGRAGGTRGSFGGGKPTAGGRSGPGGPGPRGGKSSPIRSKRRGK